MSVTTVILQILNDTGRRLLRSTLLAEVRLRMDGCGESDFRAAIRDLTVAELIVVEEDRLTKDSFYKLSPAGEQRIREGK